MHHVPESFVSDEGCFHHVALFDYCSRGYLPFVRRFTPTETTYTDIETDR
jgi:hypothetical protein